MSVMLTLAAMIPALPVVSFLLYWLLALRAAHQPAAAPAADIDVDDLHFVYLVPCLNEEMVIGNTLDRLLAVPGRNWAALIVDDGSTDATAHLVTERLAGQDRVRLLRRHPPQARQGKGAALNAAYRHLRDSSLLAGHDADTVVLVVVDADGRLQADAAAVVAPLFADPQIAAVQVGVRMYNRQSGLLARMQDMEFLVFTEIFQRARSHYGNAGLGGNGQFVRLSALESLGPAPWTDYLTEDLDMGLRLQAAGWRTAFTRDAYVSQQGLDRIYPLMRQRTRWFQGHLQCWSRIPALLASPKLGLGRVADLLVYLVSPVSVLLITLSLAAFLPGLALLLVTEWDQTAGMLLANHALLLWWYLLVLAVVPLIAVIYWQAVARTSRDTSRGQALGYAIVFSAYAYLWLPAGWWASWRLLRGHRAWAKTLRLADEPSPDVQPASATSLAATRP